MESSNDQTSADVLMLEKMEKCSCPQKLEVMFVCLHSETQCPESKNQKYYCIQCLSKAKHAHMPVVIVEEIKKIHQRWVTLKALVSEAF